MKLTIERTLVEDLLGHAAAAAHLIGHMDRADEALADHVDAVVHHLTELVGASHATSPSGGKSTAARALIGSDKGTAGDGR